MNKIKALVSLFICLLIFSACTPKTSPQNSTLQSATGSKLLTARQAYKLALPEAKKFSSDSFLVDLNTTGVGSDGQSNTWYATFYSPSKNTNLKVNIANAKVDRTEENNKNKKEPIADGWVDSPQVAQVAIPKCQEAGQVSQPDYFINLDRGKNDLNLLWNFNCLVGENKTLKVYVNAETGEFTKTGQAGIGW